jgi:hypothetical protein
MSRMYVPAEVREWLASWQEESPGLAYRTIAKAAAEQRILFESCMRDGRWIDGATEATYGRCVRMLERAVGPARKRWDAWKLDWEARTKAEQAAADAYMKALAAKYPR